MNIISTTKGSNYSWKIGTDWFFYFLLLKSYLTCVTVYWTYNVCLNKYSGNNIVIMFVQNMQTINYPEFLLVHLGAY